MVKKSLEQNWCKQTLSIHIQKGAKIQGGCQKGNLSRIVEIDKTFGT